MPRGGGSFTGPFRFMLPGPLKAADVSSCLFAANCLGFFFVFTDIFQNGGNLAWGGSADPVFVVAQGSLCFCSICVRTLF